MPNRKPGVSTSGRSSPARHAGVPGNGQRNDVSLEEIAQKTKISVRFLKAIEEDDFGQLPGGIYAASYIRQYAELSGLDADELLDRYQTQMNPEPEPKPEPPKQRPQQQRGFLDRLFRVPA